jgi:FkbM family methyltransferase
MNFYEFKTKVKRLSLATGLYRPARRLNDIVFRRKYLRTFHNDIEFFKSLLPPGILCFDIGANMGEKTEALLRAGMRVVAVEPQPLCVAEIKARCARFEDYVVRETAVGDKPGTATLYVSDIFHASSSLKSDWTPHHESIEVPLTTLDSLIQDHGVPDYCKIDVEGYELEVFKGLSRPIPLVSLECHFNKEDDVAKAFECIEHLSTLSDGRIALNLTPAEYNEFQFDEWVGLDEFRKRFPSEYSNNPDYFYADIFVKSSAAASE